MKRLLIPLLLLSIGCSKAQTFFNQSQSAHFATLPASIDFAGEKVPLQYGDVREALQREMVAVMSMHSTTLLTLSRTTRYFPVIEPILAQYGVPNDFKYLAMTESSLNPNAGSSAGARGMWQFIPSAAKDHGLETGENVDLRYNVILSTHAACKYLKKAYAIYGSWTMVAASYNAGMGGVSKRIDIQDVKNYYDLYLPEETMRYVFNIVSYKIVMANPSLYGFDLRAEDYLKPFQNIRNITVDSPIIDWSKLAADNGTNYRVLRILNPWIRSYTYNNPKQIKYVVTLPTGKFRELGY